MQKITQMEKKSQLKRLSNGKSASFILTQMLFVKSCYKYCPPELTKYIQMNWNATEIWIPLFFYYSDAIYERLTPTGKSEPLTAMNSDD